MYPFASSISPGIEFLGLGAEGSRISRLFCYGGEVRLLGLNII